MEWRFTCGCWKKKFSTCEEVGLKNYGKTSHLSVNRFSGTAINHISGNFSVQCSLSILHYSAAPHCTVPSAHTSVSIRSGGHWNDAPGRLTPREEARRHVPLDHLCIWVLSGTGWIWIFRPREARREKNHASASSSCAKASRISCCRNRVQLPWRKIWRFKGNPPLLWNCVQCANRPNC